MKVRQKTTGTASSVPGGLAYGALAAVVLTLGGAAITAFLIESEKIAWRNTGYAVLIILLLSSWIGATVTAGRVKRRRLAMCMASGGVYFAILLASTALFFGGQYSGVGETAILVFCGSILGVFSGYRGKSRRISKKMHLSNR